MNKTTVIVIIIILLGLGAYALFGPEREPSPEPESRVVKLFYYSGKDDLDENNNVKCSRDGIVPVEREIISDNLIEDTLRLLLRGELTAEERAEGLSTEYPLSGLSLETLELEENGELVLTFDDPESSTSGGSCRIGILWFQIEQTALQFSEVESVRFMPEEIFQP